MNWLTQAIAWDLNQKETRLKLIKLEYFLNQIIAKINENNQPYIFWPISNIIFFPNSNPNLTNYKNNTKD